MKWYLLFTLVLSLELSAQTRPTGNLDGECCSRPTGTIVSDEDLIIKDAAYLEEMFLAYIKQNSEKCLEVKSQDPTTIKEAYELLLRIQASAMGKKPEDCQFGISTVIQSDVSCVIGDGALTLAAFSYHPGAIEYLKKVRKMEEREAKDLIDAFNIMNESGRARLNKLRPIRATAPKVPTGQRPGEKIKHDTEESKP